MAKLTLADLANLNNPTSAVTSINANNALIEAALENTLSRDGTSPNVMGADLDMNGFSIINAVGSAGGSVTVENNVTAHAAGGQTDATQLTAMWNRVTTVAAPNASVKVPSAVPGREVLVINTTDTNTIAIYALEGETFDNPGLAPTDPMGIPPFQAMRLVCIAEGIWNEIAAFDYS